MQARTNVTGSYMGHKFSGVITESRSLTVKTDGCVEHMIDLHAPITVFGLERTQLCVYCRWDGTPSSYTKFTDSIALA